MFIKFEELNKNARVWIYQSSQVLNAADKVYLAEKLTAFTEEWQAHGKDIKASFDIVHNRFVILSADESYNQATGCSIDSSVAVIKKACEELGVDFFDRTIIAYEENGDIKTVSFQDVQKAIETNIIKSDTLVFNNLVKDVQEYQSQWKIQAGSSWLGRYFKKETVK